PTLLGPPDSCLERAAAAAGLAFLPEAFIDRAYRNDGRSLVPRSEEGALLHGAAAVRQRIRELVSGHVTDRHGNRHDLRAGTFCIHGDQTDAEETARVAWEELARLEPPPG
ncbi:MAG: LamB/YcsF family protein, partial [Saprospiraceae bacterium]